MVKRKVWANSIDPDQATPKGKPMGAYSVCKYNAFNRELDLYFKTAVIKQLLKILVLDSKVTPLSYPRLLLNWKWNHDKIIIITFLLLRLQKWHQVNYHFPALGKGFWNTQKYRFMSGRPINSWVEGQSIHEWEANQDTKKSLWCCFHCSATWHWNISEKKNYLANTTENFEMFLW